MQSETLDHVLNRSIANQIFNIFLIKIKHLLAETKKNPNTYKNSNIIILFGKYFGLDVYYSN